MDRYGPLSRITLETELSISNLALIQLSHLWRLIIRALADGKE